jgi:hypothetical protein
MTTNHHKIILDIEKSNKQELEIEDEISIPLPIVYGVAVDLVDEML